MSDCSSNDDNDDNDLDDFDSMQVSSAPPLYTRPTHFRQTRKNGRIIKTVTERYLREDLGFGCHFVDEETSFMSDKRKQHVDRVLGTAKTIENIQQLVSILQPCEPHSVVVCDANVLIHNLDVLEQSGNVMPNLIIPQTALVECRSNRVIAYDRTVELLRSVGGGGGGDNNKQRKKRCTIFFPDTHHVETAHVETSNERTTTTTPITINDENDARIRQVAAFFGRHLRSTGIRVILLTDDKGCREIAANSSSSKIYTAMSVRAWVQELERYNKGIALSDLVAQYGVNESMVNSGDIERNCFQLHLAANELSRGIQTGIYHKGVFRSISKDKGIVTIRQGEERVVVRLEGSADQNRSVDGDLVAIAVHPIEKWIKSSIETKTNVKEEQSVGIASDTAEPSISEISNVPDSMTLDDSTNWRPTGKVVGIIRCNMPTLSGSIFEAKLQKNERTDREVIAEECEREHSDGTTTCVFFAVDKKMPPILLRTSQRERLLGQRIIVAMDSWPATSPYPLGHYVKTIGTAGSKDVETQVLLQEYNIPHDPFPAAVIACLPPEDYKIDIANSPGRVDLRHLPVLSIDPPGCKDIDDALHCILLPNGNYQVGVHIADVTHYVKPGTAIDLEAANRSTSTYLVNKRLDMLPGLLTTDLCSLKGNVDRYAFSVLWEVSPGVEILNVEFKKSIIHSVAALTYQQAQIMIDQPDDPNDIQTCAVKRLAVLARKFRKRRIEAGALTLASPEVKFVLDSESLNPTDVQAYALLEANAVVEEFMLLANVTVAKKILRHFPTLSVLRRHPSPNRSMFDGLISKAKSRNLVIDIEDSKRLADSLDAAVIESDPYINKLLRILSTRCMSPAQYFCSGEYKAQDWHHYGLAAPVYTHFTSPIRRYADVCVHRLLAAAIGAAPLPQHLSVRSYLHDLCENMNRRHRSAQLAGRASVQLHTLIYFAGDGAKEEVAYVLDIETSESSEPSCTVMVPRYGIEGRVTIPLVADDPNLQRFPEQHKLTYTTTTKGTISIQVFDRVKVKIWVREIQDHQRELVLDLIDPRLNPVHTAVRQREEDGGNVETTASPSKKKRRAG